MSKETALLCSSSPGFLRNLGNLIIGNCRMMECYSIVEIEGMARNQQINILALDARHLDAQQLLRVYDMGERLHIDRIIVVAAPEQHRKVLVPASSGPKIIVTEAAVHNTDWQSIASRIINHSEESAEDAGREPATTSKPAATTAVFGVRHADPAATARAGTGDKLQTNEQPLQIADQFRTRTPELRRMLQRLEVAARHPVTMLLIGETGAGKTHLASLIHSVSPQSQHPFIHVACGALPGELIESELFGHKKGSFTSAHADKDGKFLAAGRGTILLDEIDVMTPDQQVKLLRVIEKGEFEAVGSNQTLHVEARIIAASNLPLQPLVDKGKFRPDLYYRLNTLSFIIPPLRQRLPDVEPLARHFIEHHASQLGMQVREIADDFIEALLQYPWPGNVRELENAVRSAVIYSTDGVISPASLPGHILSGTAEPGSDPSSSGFFAVRRGESLENRMELTEKEVIEQALLKNNFSRTNTARNLGISRVTLYNKMRKYGMLRKE